MDEATEVETAVDVETTATLADRRRPGRRDDVSPELIPLLRNPDPEMVPEVEFELEDVDQMATMRGLMFGLLFSAPIWAAIAYGGSFLVSR